MSRPRDLYKAMETLRKEGLSLNEDLKSTKALNIGWRIEIVK